MTHPHDLRDSGGGVRTSVVARALVISVGVLALSGCVTSTKYRLAKANPPAAQPLNIGVAGAPLDLNLATVVVFKGPGSWKKEARWDEYMLVFVNHGEQPVVIESAELIDPQGQPCAAGDDPWKLEKMSRTHRDLYGKTGLHLVEGAGATVLYGGAVVAAGGTAALSGATAGAGAVAVLGIIPVFGLMEISGVALANHDNKVKVQNEFRRRRLALPYELPAGESASGSLFFPMTPGPRRLLMRGHDGEQPLVVALDLGALTRLHLQPAN